MFNNFGAAALRYIGVQHIYNVCYSDILISMTIKSRFSDVSLAIELTTVRMHVEERAHVKALGDRAHFSLEAEDLAEESGCP